MDTNSVIRVGGIGFSVCLALFYTGCATPQKYESHKQLFLQGNYKESVAVFDADMEKRIKKAGVNEDGSTNAVPGERKYSLDDMEIGAGYRAAGEFGDSNTAFERAETGIREQQEASAVGNALRQVAAVFANDNALPYQVQEYDGIMVNTYKALNLLELGEVDDARIEFNRVAERQRMAAVRFSEQIAKSKAEEAEKPADDANPESDSETASSDAQAQENAKPGLKERIKKMISEKFKEAKGVVMGSMQDGENKTKIEDYKAMFSADTWGAEDAFTNPFATYMQGIFLLAYGEDKSDTESAVQALNTACHKETDPAKNPGANALVLAEAFANGKLKKQDLEKKVFVIFENGVCPEKQEYTIPIIIPLRMPNVEDTKFIDASLVLPKLVSRDAAYAFLTVKSGDAELAKTVSVCNMDAVIATEYRERMPAILTRNLIQSGVKAVLQSMIIDELVKEGVPSIVASSAVAALFNATKAADTRIWASLPKNFQVAVFDRPDSGELQLFAPDFTDAVATATIPSGAPAFVFVKTPATSVAPTVTVISATRK